MTPICLWHETRSFIIHIIIHHSSFIIPWRAWSCYYHGQHYYYSLQRRQMHASLFCFSETFSNISNKFILSWWIYSSTHIDTSLADEWRVASVTKTIQYLYQYLGRWSCGKEHPRQSDLCTYHIGGILIFKINNRADSFHHHSRYLRLQWTQSSFNQLLCQKEFSSAVGLWASVTGRRERW